MFSLFINQLIGLLSTSMQRQQQHQRPDGCLSLPISFFSLVVINQQLLEREKGMDGWVAIVSYLFALERRR